MKYLFSFNDLFEMKNNWVDTEKIGYREFRRIMRTECSDFNIDDTPIYRSVKLTGDYYIITNNRERQSAYATNYYTLLFNNLPSWKRYPKRQHICTDKPFKYRGGESYRVIPFNGAKVGIVPSDDMQGYFFKYTKNGKKLCDMSISNTTELTKYYAWSLADDVIQAISSVPGGKEKVKDIYELFQGKIPEDNWTNFKHKIGYANLIYKRLENELNPDAGYNKRLKVLTDIDELNKILRPYGLGIKCLDYKKYAQSKIVPPKTELGHGYGGRELWLDTHLLLIRTDKFIEKFGQPHINKLTETEIDGKKIKL